MESRRPVSAGPPPSVPPPPPARDSWRFRFSLKTLLWFVTGTAVLMGLGIAVPQLLEFVFAVVFATLPAVLTIGVVYGRGDLRAFCIGGLFPAGMKLFGRGGTLVPLSSYNRGILSLAVLVELASVAISVVAVGMLCVWMRRALERRYN